MKIEIKGKVLGNSCRPDRAGGAQKYYVEIEEGELYKSTFCVTTKDPTIAAKLEIGKYFALYGYADGRKKTEYRGTLGNVKQLKYPNYEVWIKITKVEPLTVPSAIPIPDAPPPADAATAAGESDDMPY